MGTVDRERDGVADSDEHVTRLADGASLPSTGGSRQTQPSSGIEVVEGHAIGRHADLGQQLAGGLEHRR
ncbi:hypothetical protein U6K64_12420, partial [Cutibacterium acnes]